MNRQLTRSRSAPRTRHTAQRRQAEISNLQAVGHALVETLGPYACEVIIHDLADLEHSIIWVEGNLTSRCVGGAMTDLGISKVRAGDFQDVLNYMTHTEDGRTLKSSSIFLRDDDGEAWGAFCVNIDVTPFVGLVNRLQSSLLRFGETDVVETFSDDVEVTVRNWLSEAAFELGKPIDSLTRGDRLRLIQILERKGLFQIKRAIPLLARYLHVSRYTIYMDLNDLREQPRQPMRDGVRPS